MNATVSHDATEIFERETRVMTKVGQNSGTHILQLDNNSSYRMCIFANIPSLPRAHNLSEFSFGNRKLPDAKVMEKIISQSDMPVNNPW